MARGIETEAFMEAVARAIQRRKGKWLDKFIGVGYSCDSSTDWEKFELSLNLPAMDDGTFAGIVQEEYDKIIQSNAKDNVQ